MSETPEKSESGAPMSIEIDVPEPTGEHVPPEEWCHESPMDAAEWAIDDEKLPPLYDDA